MGGKWKNRIKLTPKRIEELRHHRDRTCIGAHVIAKIVGEKTEYTSAGVMISKWLGGTRDSADCDLYEEVLAAWKTMPDASPEQEHRRLYFKAPRIYFTESDIAALKEEIARIDHPLNTIWKLLNNKPSGLKLHTVQSWLRGKTKSTIKEYYEYVLKSLQKVDGKHLPSRIALTDPMRRELQYHRMRTGLTPYMIIKLSCGEDMANRLQPTVVSWLKGAVLTVDERLYRQVLNDWKASPDKSSAPRKKSSKHRLAQEKIKLPESSKVHITRSVRNRLFKLQDQSGLTPRAFLDEREDVPSGLTSTMIHSWMSRQVEVARTDHVKYVLENWRVERLNF